MAIHCFGILSPLLSLMVVPFPPRLSSNRLRTSDGQTVGHCKAESPWIYDHVSGFSQNALWVRHDIINLLPLTEDEDIEKEENSWKETMPRATLACAWSYFHRENVKVWVWLHPAPVPGSRLSSYERAGWVHRRGHCGNLIHSLMPKCFHDI